MMLYSPCLAVNTTILSLVTKLYAKFAIYQVNIVTVAEWFIQRTSLQIWDIENTTIAFGPKLFSITSIQGI